MHQGPGSRWKVLGSETAFPTVEIFQIRSLGFSCGIWWARSLEVNNFVVSFPTSPPAPDIRILLFIIISFGSVSQFCSQAGTPSWLLQKGWLRTLVPSCCPWAVLLSWHGLDCCPTVGTVSDMVAPLLSSVLCGLTCFLRAMSLELQLCSVAPSRLTATAGGQKSQSRIGGWRGQGKQGRGWHSSKFSVSCWVFLCVMSIWGSWGYLEALSSVLLCWY